MHYASKFGNASVLQQLVPTLEEWQGTGKPIDAPTSDGSTALHLGAAKGHVDVVQKLCDLGANVNCEDGFGASPLQRAVQGSPTPEPGDSRRSEAAVAAVLGVLVRYGSRVDAPFREGGTPLSRAVELDVGNPAIEVLARHGAPILDPLVYAITRGKSESAEKLLLLAEQA